MTINYRPHRGSFEESMSEMKTFTTCGELMEKESISKIEFYAYDGRLPAETFIALHKDNYPLGFVWFTA